MGDQVGESTSPIVSSLVSLPARLASTSVSLPVSPSISPPQQPDAHDRAMIIECTDMPNAIVSETNGQEEIVDPSCDQDQVCALLRNGCDSEQADAQATRLEELIHVIEVPDQEVQSSERQQVAHELVTSGSTTESIPTHLRSVNGNRQGNDFVEAIPNGDGACNNSKDRSNNIEYLLTSNKVQSLGDVNSTALVKDVENDSGKVSDLQFSKLGTVVQNGHVCLKSDISSAVVEGVISSHLLGKLQENSKGAEEQETLIESHDRSDGSDSGLGSESAEILFSNSADELCSGAVQDIQLVGDHVDAPAPSPRSEDQESVFVNAQSLVCENLQSEDIKDSSVSSSSQAVPEPDIAGNTEPVGVCGPELIGVGYGEKADGSDIVDNDSLLVDEQDSCRSLGTNDNTRFSNESSKACTELSEYSEDTDVKFQTAVEAFACENLGLQLSEQIKYNGSEEIANCEESSVSVAMPNECIVETETLNDDNIPTFDDLRTPPGEAETKTCLEDEEDDIPLQTPTVTVAPILSDFSMKGGTSTSDQEESVSNMVCQGEDSVDIGFSNAHEKTESLTVSSTEDQSCVSGLIDEALPGTSRELPHSSMSSPESSSDSKEIDRRRSTLKRSASSTCDGESQPKKKKSLVFDSVSVYYFPRTQGFTCVPSQVSVCN